MVAKKKAKESARDRCLSNARLVGIITATPRPRDKGYRLLVTDFGNDALEHLEKIAHHQRGRFLGAMLAETAQQTKRLTRIFCSKPKSG